MMSVRTWGQNALMASLVLLAACGGGSDRDARSQEEVNAMIVKRSAIDYSNDQIESIDGPRRNLSQLPFDLSWDLPLNAPVHRSWIGPETKNLLMVQLVTGEVQCMDIMTGKTLWVTSQLPKPITLAPHVARLEEKDPATGRVIRDDRLYIISGDELFVFDCAYGQLIWRHHLGQSGRFGFQPSSGPYAHGFDQNLRVYVGDWDGRVRVISRHPGANRSYHAWQWNLNSVPTGQPTGFEDMTYVGTRNGRMFCFGLAREKLWEFNAHGAIKGSAYVRGYNLYFGASDNIFHVCNRLSGEDMGSIFLGAEIKDQPFAFDSEPLRIYTWTKNHSELAGLHRLKTMDDRIKIEDFPEERVPLEVNRLGKDWFYPGISHIVASSPDHLYATRPNSAIVIAIDRRTGKADWHWDLNEGRSDAEKVTHLTYYQDPTDDLRSIVTADKNGYLRVYRLFGHQ